MAQTTPSEVAGANSAAPVAVLVVDGNEDHQILSIAAVTRRKAGEEQLSQSQARLKLVLEQAPVLLWSTDRDLRVTAAMGTGFRGLDLPRSGQRVLSIYEYFNIHDDDIEPIVSHRRALLGESVATQIEWQGRMYDVHMEPLRSKEGAILGTIGVAFDVSERTRTEESLRRSEERFLLLGRATNDVVWDWDLQTDGMWMNDNLAAMFGYRAEDVEPTGTWWEERLHPDDRGRVGASVDDLIGTGGAARGGGHRFRRPRRADAPRPPPPGRPLRRPPPSPPPVRF